MDFLPPGTVFTMTKTSSTEEQPAPFVVIADFDTLTFEEQTRIIQSGKDVYALDSSWDERILVAAEDLHKMVLDYTLRMSLPVPGPGDQFPC